MRTNIVLDDELVEEAFRYSTERTKRALVEEALRVFVEVRSAEERKRRYREQLADLRLRLDGCRLGESSLELLRRDRERG